MEMHQVRYFLSVARHLNFTQASRELRVSQPSLTRAIQRLEGELGGELFRRERSNTHLSHLGRAMLPHLEAAFTSAEAAKALAGRLGREAGTLAIGVCAGVEPGPTAAAIVEATARMSGLSVDILVASGDAVESRLLAGELDAAILARLSQEDDRFRMCQIGADAMVVAFAKGHRFEEGARVAMSDLRDEVLVVQTDRRHERVLARVMDERGDERGVGRLIRHRVNDARWLADLVRRGQGCAVVPETLARTHALVHRPLEGGGLTHRTMFATVPGRPHSPALTALIQQICGISSA